MIVVPESFANDGDLVVESHGGFPAPVGRLQHAHWHAAVVAAGRALGGPRHDAVPGILAPFWVNRGGVIYWVKGAVHVWFWN